MVEKWEITAPHTLLDREYTSAAFTKLLHVYDGRRCSQVPPSTAAPWSSHSPVSYHHILNSPYLDPRL